MKNITLLIFILFVGIGYSQTNSTGQVALSMTSGIEMGVQIDVTATEVTLQLGGPSDRWLGVGFGVSSMTNGGDVVIFDGTNLTDRTFGGIGVIPSLDANQDWTIVSTDTSVPGYIGIVATRALDTGETNDYVFNLTDTSISLVWARGDGTFTLGYHQSGNRGATVAGFTLGVDKYDLADFKITPNPVTTNFEIQLPSGVTNANISVYNVLGKQVHAQDVSELNASVDTTNWNSGVYLVRLSSGNASNTKRIVKL